MSYMPSGYATCGQWKKWDGGECPVHPDTRVEAKLRDGSKALDWAGRLEWRHRRIDAHPAASDIVAYRVESPFAQPIPSGGLHAPLIDAIKKSTWVAGNAGLLYAPPSPHAHYFKSVAHLDTIDVYRVLSLFSVTDPCLQHAIKKLLVAGGRGAGKDIGRDVQEAIDSLVRWQSMRQEDEAAK